MSTPATTRTSVFMVISESLVIFTSKYRAFGKGVIITYVNVLGLARVELELAVSGYEAKNLPLRYRDWLKQKKFMIDKTLVNVNKIFVYQTTLSSERHKEI